MGNESESGGDPAQTQEGTIPPSHPELIQQLAEKDGMEPNKWVKTQLRLAIVRGNLLVSPEDKFVVLDLQGTGQISATVVCTYSTKEDGEAHVALAREKRQGGIHCLYSTDGQPCDV